MRDLVAVWMGGLDGTTWYEQHADEPILAASLIKVPVAVAASSLDLDATVEVHADFDSVVPGERFVLDEAGDQDPDTWAALGFRQPLRELVRRSIVSSGNLATDLVMEEIGVAACTAVLPQVVRMIGDQPATDRGIHNLASARQWGAVLGRVGLVHHSVESVMVRQVYRSGIPTGLPVGIPMANKTGWIDGHTHDMAIVRPQDSAPFALVVLTRLAGIPTAVGYQRIAETAASVYQHRR